MPLTLGEIEATLRLRDSMTPQLRASTGALTAFGNALSSVNRQASAVIPTTRAVLSQVTKMSNMLGRAGISASLAGVSLSVAFAPITKTLYEAVTAAMSFEDAFALVRKTLDTSNLSEKEANDLLANMATQFRELAKEMPFAVEGLAKIGSLGAQLSIPTNELVEFTKNVAALGVAVTGIDADTAALELAQIAQITGPGTENIKRMASALVHLGNTTGALEPTILEFAKRIAGGGKQVGLATDEIFGLSAALARLGVNPELGGTAINRLLQDIDKAVKTGSGQLFQFAELAGVTAEQFADAWEKKPIEAFKQFIAGMATAEERGIDVTVALSEMGLDAARLREVILKLHNAGDTLNTTLKKSKEGYLDGQKHLEEYGKRAQTTSNQVKLLWNHIKDVGITLGNAFLPLIVEGTKSLLPFVNLIEKAVVAFTKLPAPIRAAAGALVILAGSFSLLLVGFGQVAYGLGQLGTLFNVLKAGAKSASNAIKGVGAIGNGAAGASGAAQLAGNLTKASTAATTANTALRNTAIQQAAVATTATQAAKTVKQASEAVTGLGATTDKTAGAAKSAATAVAGLGRASAASKAALATNAVAAASTAKGMVQARDAMGRLLSPTHEASLALAAASKAAADTSKATAATAIGTVQARDAMGRFLPAANAASLALASTSKQAGATATSTYAVKNAMGQFIPVAAGVNQGLRGTAAAATATANATAGMARGAVQAKDAMGRWLPATHEASLALAAAATQQGVFANAAAKGGEALRAATPAIQQAAGATTTMGRQAAYMGEQVGISAVAVTGMLGQFGQVGPAAQQAAGATANMAHQAEVAGVAMTGMVGAFGGAPSSAERVEKALAKTATQTGLLKRAFDLLTSGFGYVITGITRLVAAFGGWPVVLASVAAGLLLGEKGLKSLLSIVYNAVSVIGSFASQTLRLFISAVSDAVVGLAKFGETTIGLIPGVNQLRDTLEKTASAFKVAAEQASEGDWSLIAASIQNSNPYLAEFLRLLTKVNDERKRQAQLAKDNSPEMKKFNEVQNLLKIRKLPTQPGAKPDDDPLAERRRAMLADREFFSNTRKRYEDLAALLMKNGKINKQVTDAIAIGWVQDGDKIDQVIGKIRQLINDAGGLKGIPKNISREDMVGALDVIQKSLGKTSHAVDRFVDRVTGKQAAVQVVALSKEFDRLEKQGVEPASDAMEKFLELLLKGRGFVDQLDGATLEHLKDQAEDFKKKLSFDNLDTEWTKAVTKLEVQLEGLEGKDLSLIPPAAMEDFQQTLDQFRERFGVTLDALPEDLRKRAPEMESAIMDFLPSEKFALESQRRIQAALSAPTNMQVFRADADELEAALSRIGTTSQFTLEQIEQFGVQAGVIAEKSELVGQPIGKWTARAYELWKQMILLKNGLIDSADAFTELQTKAAEVAGFDANASAIRDLNLAIQELNDTPVGFETVAEQADRMRRAVQRSLDALPEAQRHAEGFGEVSKKAFEKVEIEIDHMMQTWRRNGEATQAELGKMANDARAKFESMRASGEFSADAVRRAWEQSVEAILAQFGDLGKKALELFDGIGGVIGNEFAAIIGQTKSFSEAFLDIFRGIRNELLKIFADIVKDFIRDLLLKLVEAAAGKRKQIGASAAAAVQAAAGIATAGATSVSAGAPVQAGIPNMEGIGIGGINPMTGAATSRTALSTGAKVFTIIGAGAAGFLGGFSAGQQGGTKNVLGGLGTGAISGAALGLKFGPQGAVIGAVVGAVAAGIGAIIGHFKKPEWRKVLSDVGKKWGVSISEGLAQAIAVDSKKMGDRMTAETKHIAEIIKEAGGVEAFGVDKAIKATRDLFVGIERGLITVKDAASNLQDLFPELAEAATDSNGLISASFRELIDLSHRFGVEFAALTEWVNQQSERLAGGIDKLVHGFATGIQKTFTDAFKHLKVPTDVVTGLWDALGDPDAMKEALKNFGEAAQKASGDTAKGLTAVFGPSVLAAFKQTSSDAAKEVKKLSAELKAMKASGTASKAEIKALEERLSSAKTRLSLATGAVKDMSKHGVDMIKQLVDAAGNLGKIDGLKVSLEGAKAKAAAAKTEVHRLKERLDELKRAGKENTTEFRDLEHQLDAAKRRLHDAEGAVDGLKRKLKGLQSTDAAQLLKLLPKDLQDKLRKSGGDVGAILKAIAKDVQPEFDRLSRIALAAFNAMIKEGKSPVDAIRAIGGSVDELSGVLSKLEGSGLKSSKALDQLRRFRGLVKDNEALVDSVSGLNDALVVLSNFGALDSVTFKDLLGEAGELKKKLHDAGFSDLEILRLMAPALDTIRELHNRTGFAIDEETQKLIEAADAQGFLKDKGQSTNDILMEGLGAIITALHGELPQSFKDFADKAKKDAQGITDAVNNIPTRVNIKVNYDVQGSPTVPGTGTAVPRRPPGVATGGLITPSMFAEGGAVSAVGATVRGGWVQKTAAHAAKKMDYLAAGGPPTLVEFRPKGTDTVPAMLTPGEFVQTTQAVKQYGTQGMEAIRRGSATVLLNAPLPKRTVSATDVSIPLTTASLGPAQMLATGGSVGKVMRKMATGGKAEEYATGGLVAGFAVGGGVSNTSPTGGGSVVISAETGAILRAAREAALLSDTLAIAGRTGSLALRSIAGDAERVVPSVASARDEFRHWTDEIKQVPREFGVKIDTDDEALKDTFFTLNHLPREQALTVSANTEGFGEITNALATLPTTGQFTLKANAPELPLIGSTLATLPTNATFTLHASALGLPSILDDIHAIPDSQGFIVRASETGLSDISSAVGALPTGQTFLLTGASTGLDDIQEQLGEIPTEYPFTLLASSEGIPPIVKALGDLPTQAGFTLFGDAIGLDDLQSDIAAIPQTGTFRLATDARGLEGIAADINAIPSSAPFTLLASATSLNPVAEQVEALPTSKPFRLVTDTRGMADLTNQINAIPASRPFEVVASETRLGDIARQVQAIPTAKPFVLDAESPSLLGLSSDIAALPSSQSFLVVATASGLTQVASNIARIPETQDFRLQASSSGLADVTRQIGSIPMEQPFRVLAETEGLPDLEAHLAKIPETQSFRVQATSSGLADVTRQVDTIPTEQALTVRATTDGVSQVVSDIARIPENQDFRLHATAAGLADVTRQVQSVPKEQAFKVLASAEGLPQITSDVAAIPTERTLTVTGTERGVNAIATQIKGIPSERNFELLATSAGLPQIQAGVASIPEQRNFRVLATETGLTAIKTEINTIPAEQAFKVIAGIIGVPGVLLEIERVPREWPVLVVVSTQGIDDAIAALSSIPQSVPVQIDLLPPASTVAAQANDVVNGILAALNRLPSQITISVTTGGGGGIGTGGGGGGSHTTPQVPGNPLPLPTVPTPYPGPVFGGGGGGGFTLRTFATGGYVSGIDRIPALLRAGEFVMPPEAVRQYGRDAMEALRQGEVSLVPAEVSRAVAGTSEGGGNVHVSVGDIKIEIKVGSGSEWSSDPDTLARQLASRLADELPTHILKQGKRQTRWQRALQQKKKG